MHPPLTDWDSTYVLSIASSPDETLDLEKKQKDLFDPAGNKGRTRAELAKQLCAFSNSSHGFLVYGMIDKGGGLDDGVAEIAVGTQSSKAWVEAEAPRLIEPPVHDCQVRHIHVPGHHKPGQGVLVVEICLSDRRPHWITDNGRDVPYIRAGEHSSPMGLQTFLDLSSRTAASAGVIKELGQFGGGESNSQIGGWVFRFNPIIELITGPPCELWCLVLKLLERGNSASPAPLTRQCLRQTQSRSMAYGHYSPVFRLARVRRISSCGVLRPLQ